MAMFGDEVMGFTKTPQQYCAEIADFLSTHRDAWTQGSMARDASGEACDTDDPAARRWCALGLIDKFARWPHLTRRCATLLSRVVTPIYAKRDLPRSPAAYNDAPGRTVDDVITMFRCASYMPELPEDGFYVVPAMAPFEDQPLPEQAMPTASAFLGEMKALKSDCIKTMLAELSAATDVVKLIEVPKPAIQLPSWKDFIQGPATVNPTAKEKSLVAA